MCLHHDVNVSGSDYPKRHHQQKQEPCFRSGFFIISEYYEELMSLWTGIVPENTGRKRRTIWTNCRLATSYWKKRMRCWRPSCSAWGHSAYIWHQDLNCTAFNIPLWSFSSFGYIKIYKLIVFVVVCLFLWFVHAVCWQKPNVQRESAHQGLAMFVFLCYSTSEILMQAYYHCIYHPSSFAFNVETHQDV